MVTAELEDLVNTQRNQINQLASKMKENEDLHSGYMQRCRSSLGSFTSKGRLPNPYNGYGGLVVRCSMDAFDGWLVIG
jgi:hypothetical protein